MEVGEVMSADLTDLIQRLRKANTAFNTAALKLSAEAQKTPHEFLTQMIEMLLLNCALFDEAATALATAERDRQAREAAVQRLAEATDELATCCLCEWEFDDPPTPSDRKRQVVCARCWPHDFDARGWQARAEKAEAKLSQAEADGPRWQGISEFVDDGTNELTYVLLSDGLAVFEGWRSRGAWFHAATAPYSTWRECRPTHFQRKPAPPRADAEAKETNK